MENRMDRECGEDAYYGRGHRNGFRHILPFLAIPLAIGIMRGVMQHKFAQMDEGPYGPEGSHRHGAHLHGWRREGWKNGVPPMFAEMHRRAHAAEAEKPDEGVA